MNVWCCQVAMQERPTNVVLPSLSILHMLLCFWVFLCLNFHIPCWQCVSKAKGLDLHSPFVPLGWKAVSHVEPLCSWTPFHPSLWKRRTLGWEDQDKRRQPHVLVLCLGSYGAAEFTANLSGNVFSSKLILFSFHCLIKWTSKMTGVFLGPFPMAAKHLPSIAPPPPQHTVSFIVVK